VAEYTSTFACVLCGEVHAAEGGFQITQPICAEIGDEEGCNSRQLREMHKRVAKSAADWNMAGGE